MEGDIDSHGREVRYLTPGEKKAISELQALAKRWPRTLWLFSASGSLTVMLQGEDGHHVMQPSRFEAGSADPAYEVAIIQGIDNDGGDY